jgi:ABC-type molybdenum transport system ATPase subunit/photorepair protein PhrA
MKGLPLLVGILVVVSAFSARHGRAGDESRPAPRSEQKSRPSVVVTDEAHRNHQAAIVIDGIALARVFLKNPPILILDEGTSALDNISERKVQRALVEARQEPTVILVAHRLSTLRDADRILVFSEAAWSKPAATRSCWSAMELLPNWLLRLKKAIARRIRAGKMCRSRA